MTTVAEGPPHCMSWPDFGREVTLDEHFRELARTAPRQKDFTREFGTVREESS